MAEIFKLNKIKINKLSEDIQNVFNVIPGKEKYNVLKAENRTIGQYYKANNTFTSSNANYYTYEPVVLSAGTYYAKNIHYAFTTIKNNSNNSLCSMCTLLGTSEVANPGDFTFTVDYDFTIYVTVYFDDNNPIVESYIVDIANIDKNDSVNGLKSIYPQINGDAIFCNNSLLPNVNDIDGNMTYIMYFTNASQLPANMPINTPLDGRPLIFKQYSFKANGDSFKNQVLEDYGNVIASRTCNKDNSWQAWSYSNQDSEVIINVGAGQEYTTLRSGIAKGVELGCKVIVHPGTYDLTQEFSTEITNQSESGILLDNNVNVVFMAGSYVKALFDNTSRWVYDNFEPFKVHGNFTLDGLNIEASNCRYCVHDERGGAVGAYYHRYINCIMKYTNTHTDINYVQCIGGGLGQNAYIDIIGGVYTSYSTVAYNGCTLEETQQPISYHNGNNPTADSKIFIKDVYLADKGRFRFGMYGPSTIKTPVVITGCSMYAQTVIGFENSEYSVENFNLIEWNNNIRN